MADCPMLSPVCAGRLKKRASDKALREKKRMAAQKNAFHTAVWGGKINRLQWGTYIFLFSARYSLGLLPVIS